ncbi:MAG: TonB family protein [Acidobacteriota bacterium]|nr:TonB family protein [Acidobacteriota bacterium]
MYSSRLYRSSLFGRLSMLLASAVLSLASAIPAIAQSAMTVNQGAKTRMMPHAEELSSMPGSGVLSQDALEHVLEGKTLYLRSGYMDDTLDFDETGQLRSVSPRGSFTLALVRIEKIRLSRKRLELEGIRYGLHFRGELPTEDFAANTDEVRITPKKKVVKITIAREQVVKPKKKHRDGQKSQKGLGLAKMTSETADKPLPEDEEETVTQEQADSLLRAALNRIFASHIDERLVATMPAPWQAFFETSHHPQNPVNAVPGVLSQTKVDEQARLTAAVEPASNDFAQKAGIAGMALYHVVVDTSGRAESIEVARPIGFGLDENAVKAIEQAKFQPAIKNGKPILAEVDVVVQFRIYSKRTNVAAPADESAGAGKSILPGPYSVPRS